MRGSVAFLLLLQILFIVSTGKAQYYYGHHYPSNFYQPLQYFRSAPFQDGRLAMKAEPEARLFFSALTLTLTTTTVTRTVTSSTVCTTTTAALVACVVAGGRRKRQELFYNDDSLADDESSIFLPLSEKQLERLVPASEEDPNRQLSKNLPHYPIALEPGFNPAGRNGARFLLAVDTSTIFTTTTSLLTVSLTAICSSTTTFSACTSSG